MRLKMVFAARLVAAAKPRHDPPERLAASGCGDIANGQDRPMADIGKRLLYDEVGCVRRFVA
jgi:hypothetical protein